MNLNFAFFVMGEKGLVSLSRFISQFGAQQIAFVVSSEDKAVKHDYFEEIKSETVSHNIPFYSRKNYSDSLITQATITVAIGWRWLIRDPGLLIVFHDSILPKYRGFAPLVNMLKNGETEIGVTALIGVDEYDKGPILGVERISVDYPIKISEAIRIVAEAYSELLLRITSDYLSSGKLNGVPQDETLATYSVWLDEKDYFIDWKLNSVEIARFIDAVGDPYHGALTRLNDKVVRILDAEIRPDVQIEQRDRHVGKVLFLDNKLPTVICGSGLIKLRKYEDATSGQEIKEIPFRSRFMQCPIQ